MRCKRCGNELPKKNEFCPYCGYQLIKTFTVSVPQLKVLDHTPLHSKISKKLFRGRNITKWYSQILIRSWKTISLLVLAVLTGVLIFLVYYFLLLLAIFLFTLALIPSLAATVAISTK
ncbi:MAG: zinc-ribbon domain-containing protein [Promethearchaeota archaeon]